ncbi:hypothetical protein N8500_06060 [Candidatus Puniceispirillum sp.]|nr:hypothetical protein [Candidatus Puniceispirillum sp.]
MMLFGPGVKADTNANSVNDSMVGKSMGQRLINQYDKTKEALI